MKKIPDNKGKPSPLKLPLKKVNLPKNIKTWTPPRNGYDASFCQKVRAYGAKGLLPVQIRCNLCMSQAMWTDWRSRYPEFMEATEDAKGLAAAWLLAKGLLKTEGKNKNGDSSMIKYLLSAGHGISEKTEQNITAQIDARVTVTDWGDGEEEVEDGKAEDSSQS